MISLTHSAPRTLPEISVGTPAAAQRLRHGFARRRRLDHQFAAAVVLDVAGAGHLGRDVNDRRCDLPRRQHRAQPVGVVHAVLQAQHQRARRQVRLDLCAGGFGIGGLDAEQDEVRALDGTGVRAGRDPHVLVEGPGFHAQAVAGNGVHVLRPRDQHDVMAGAGQHAAEVAADGACAHHGDFDELGHGAILGTPDNPCAMAYVDLSQDKAAMRRIFVSLGLAGRNEPVEATALTGGVSSGIYRVDLRSGSYCVKQALPRLKVAKEWNVPVERVFSEIDWLKTADRIVPGHVPRVLGQDDATKSFVMEFLGPDFRNWKADMLDGHIDLAVARAVGDVLGRIHAATADNAVLASRFATDVNFHAIRLEPYLVEAARVHPALAERLLATVDRTAGSRRVLVHGDVSPKNIMVGPEGPVLLDAECAWFGDPAFDLAFCLNHFLLKSTHMPRRTADLMAGLRLFVQAYRAHVRWESWDALEARVARLLPGLTLARIDGKSPVEYLGTPQREAVRGVAVGLLQEAPLHLEDIAARWAGKFNA